MGFHVVGSLSDGCDQSEVPVIADYGGNFSEMMEPLHSFRITSHPAAALEDSILEKQPSLRLPSGDIKSPDAAARQLRCLSLGETSSDATTSLQGHPSSHAGLHSVAVGSNAIPHIISLPVYQPPPTTFAAPYEQRCSSPAPSLASVQSSVSSSAGSSSVTRAQRARFLIFMKILFKCLEQAHEFELRDQAKQIVAECTRRNRNGDPNFTPLMDAVERRLRRLVGEAHWKKSSMLLRYFAAKQSGLTGNSIPREISGEP